MLVLERYRELERIKIERVRVRVRGVMCVVRGAVAWCTLPALPLSWWCLRFFFERARHSSGGVQLMIGRGFVGFGLLWGYDLRRLF